ncbi:glutamate ligase domain-containing protein, partial [Lacticaseibacillus saniviri]|nr:UDP-N-acetylmuramoyl-tripeptide--D-alanyl-D-alanine ligase [Lacticaseibacillus saniviri]
GKRIAVLGDMLELGDASRELHQSIAPELDPATIADVYLYGPEMAALRDVLVDKYPAAQLHYYTADQQAQLIADLKADLTADDIVMLKASHGLHLENVLTALTEA